MRSTSPARRLVALTAALALLAACGDGDGGDTGADTTTTADTAAPTTAEAAPELEAVEVTLTPVAELDDPIAMALRPGHEPFFVAERAGRVQVVTGGEVGHEPILDINEETTTEVERGLLGLAFSPEGEHLYVSYTDPDGTSRIDEYAFGEEATAIDTGSRRPVIEVEQPFPNHNGGHLVFGPDELLYFSFGDGGAAGDPMDNGQDPSTLLGSMMRIDPRPSGDAPYTIPADNPFVDAGGAEEVWAYGLRNPWRFSFDRETDDLWIADVGQDEIEEVNLVPAGEGAGANFGWSLMEGTRHFEGSDGPPEGHWAPVFEYPSEGARCSVTGGYVYRGSAIPDLAGAYVWGDYCEGEVHALGVDDGEVTGSTPLDIAVDPGTLVSFGEDADGELYVLSFEGVLSRIDPA